MNVLDDPVYAAVCAGVKREPLGGHWSDGPQRVAACTLSECADMYAPAYHADTCRGCMTRYTALVVQNPEQIVLSYHLGRDVTALEAFRAAFDELDPLRVVVERELARRGIA